ncbi:TIGR04211 family SH3 domain-containing protein [Vreelandella aquamarina]
MKVTQCRARATMAMLLLSLASGSAFAQSNEAWVSDELSTYVRSGPTDGYRIIGTLTAGEQVDVLETSGDYTRVRNSDGNAVWVLSNEIQDTPSAREKLPELERQVEALSTELEGINEQWEQRVASMTETLELRENRAEELENRNTALDEEAEQLRQQVRALQARLDTQEEDLLMRYFMYGGGVAGAGLIVGLIVPHLPRRRKKRDRWFQ